MATLRVTVPACRESDFRLPDPPEKRPDERMSANRELSRTGNELHVRMHIGNPETTIVRSEMTLTRFAGDTFRRRPDLMIALDANVALFERQNGYVIADQSKPPDFVLEIASRSTGDRDVGQKRDEYEQLLIPEYWTFDRTGQFHGMRLAGRSLVNRRYVCLPIETIEHDVLQGASPRLNLSLRWNHGDLEWIDTRTGLHIITFEHLQEEAAVERSGRLRAERDRDSERAAREMAERRIAELEVELESHRSRN